MQLRLYFNFPEPLTMPLNYQHIVQGFIYNTLQAEPEYSAFLHDCGYSEDNRPFKLFVFSLLEGKYNIRPPYITFEESLTFELRSPMNAFCDIFYLALMHREAYELHRKPVYLTGCVSTKRTITDDEITVRTLSPLCLNRTYTEGDKKKTLYLSPFDEDFNAAVQGNFLRKYRAAFDRDPKSNINIEPVSVTDKDKFVTKFADRTYITAWNGIYKLYGSPESLSFLYDSGIGAKNSQGFGMAELT